MALDSETTQNIAVGWVTRAPQSGGVGADVRYDFFFRWLFRDGGFSMNDHKPTRGFQDEDSLLIVTPAREGEVAFYSVVRGHAKVRLFQGAEVFSTDECGE